MRREIMRQFVHLSGLGFVYLSQFFDKNHSASIFLLIALSFLFYSWYVRRQMSRTSKLISIVEERARRVLLHLDRDNLPMPFMGPFWFYMGFFLAYLLFPLEIAMASCAILSVGDALSTLAGKAIGRNEYLPGKTAEGSLAFFIGGLLVTLLILPPAIAFAGALAGTLAETAPSLKRLRNLYARGFVDDNLLIPLAAGLVMLLL
jgi:dolichol kinase